MSLFAQLTLSTLISVGGRSDMKFLKVLLRCSGSSRSLTPGQRRIPHKGKKSLVSPARTSEMGARPGPCVGGYGESRAGRLWHREDTVKISTSGHSLASAFLSSFCSSCFPTSPIQAFPELRAPNATKRHFTAHATHSLKSSSDVMKQARLETRKSPKYHQTDTISSCGVKRYCDAGNLAQCRAVSSKFSWQVCVRFAFSM